jgi:hypothetical protein
VLLSNLVTVDLICIMARDYKRRIRDNFGKPGVVYILSNDGLREGWYKVGCSTRSGAIRASELNEDATTGTPGLFKCVFQIKTKDCGLAEATVFEKLSIHRRGKWGQEYFECNIESIKETITLTCELIDAKIPPPPLKPDPPKAPPIVIQPAPTIVRVNPKEPKRQSNGYWGVILSIFFLYIFLSDSSDKKKEVDLHYDHSPATEIAQPNNLEVRQSRDLPESKEATLVVPDPFIPPEAVHDSIKEALPLEKSHTEASIPDQREMVLSAEKKANLKSCSDGRYPALCRHELLTETESADVLRAEKIANLKSCLDGRYPALCRHEILSAEEASNVLAAEKRANLKSCSDGGYPALCRHELLTETESADVLRAEKKANLKVCSDGRYPALCRHDLLD